MITFKTYSGSTYEVDEAMKRFRRVPRTEGQAYRRLDDGQWIGYAMVHGLAPDSHGVIFEFTDQQTIHTTAVVEFTDDLATIPTRETSIQE